MTENIMHRGLGRNNADYKLKDIYKSYKKNLDKKEKGTIYDVSHSTFMSFMKGCILDITNLIIYKNLRFKLPSRLGAIFIKKRSYNVNSKRISVDWEATNALWEEDPEAKEKKILIRHLNEHTDGHIYKWHWEKKDCVVRNKSNYCFKPSRTNKRKLAKVLKDTEIKTTYYE